MQDLSNHLKMLVSLVVIVNPLGAIPIFLGLTAGQTAKERQRTGYQAAVAVAAVLLMAGLAGAQVLKLFNISLASFRLGGGLLILLMAVAMMHGLPSRSTHSTEEIREAEDKDNTAVVPLAVPMLAGPGAISTMIIYADQAKGWGEMAFLGISSFLVGILVWGALKLAMPIFNMIGKTGINIATRLMGLLLAAIGFEFITHGLIESLTGLSIRIG